MTGKLLYHICSVEELKYIKKFRKQYVQDLEINSDLNRTVSSQNALRQDISFKIFQKISQTKYNRKIN